MDQEPKSSGGLTAVGLLLTVIFAVMKLMNIITWDWYWVCAPLLVVLGVKFGMSLLDP